MITIKNTKFYPNQKKLKIKNFLIETYRNLKDFPDFERNYYSQTGEGVYKNGHDSIRLKKWMAFCDQSYHGNINYCDLMAIVFCFKLSK